MSCLALGAPSYPFAHRGIAIAVTLSAVCATSCTFVHRTCVLIDDLSNYSSKAAIVQRQCISRIEQEDIMAASQLKELAAHNNVSFDFCERLMQMEAPTVHPPEVIIRVALAFQVDDLF